jgi:ribosomal protein L37AE/L43A
MLVKIATLYHAWGSKGARQMKNKWSCPSCGLKDYTRLDEYGVWGYLCTGCGEMHYVNPAGTSRHQQLVIRVQDTLPKMKTSSS